MCSPYFSIMNRLRAERKTIFSVSEKPDSIESCGKFVDFQRACLASSLETLFSERLSDMKQIRLHSRAVRDGEESRPCEFAEIFA